MRVWKRWALPLLALLLTAAGALLPCAVSAVQDVRVESAPEIRQFDPVNLTLQEGSGVQETLRLLSGSTSEMEWHGSARLTEGEAASAAREALRLLNESGILGLTPEALGTEEFTISTEPHIIMSMNESALSAIVWVCWIEEMSSNWIFIDDETGKMVRAFLFETMWPNANKAAAAYDSSLNQSTDTEEAAKVTEQWRVFLSEYYGMSFQDAELTADNYSTVSMLRFDGGEVRLELTAADGAMYFNA